MRKQYTAAQREQLVAQVRAGERVSVVAKRLGVTVSSAYLWMKAVAAGPSAPVFARVVPSPAATLLPLRLELRGAVLVVEAGFDAELLRQVVTALRDATSSAKDFRST